MLEGYLIALLVWPIGLMPGAWLPPIWGEQGGWRVPEKIRAPDAFAKFTSLVIGFLQELDRGLRANPPRFAPTIGAEALAKHEAPHHRCSLGTGICASAATKLARPHVAIDRRTYLRRMHCPLRFASDVTRRAGPGNLRGCVRSGVDACGGAPFPRPAREFGT